MKNNIFLLLLFGMLLFVGCFEDEGNYDYKKVEGPTWLINTETEPIRVTCSQGETVKFRGHDYFVWKEDSARMEDKVRYEWKLNDIVIGDKADFDMPTDTLIKMLGITEFSENGLYGSFSVIDRASEVNYMAKMLITIRSRYSKGDWLVLTEQGGNTVCSFVKNKKEMINGTLVTSFVLEENLYERLNGSSIPGKPLMMVKSPSTNISPLGATTIITDQVAYVISNESLLKVSELKDEFLDGTPANFQVVSRRDADHYTFVATKDGRVFRRVMSENFLGGKFLTEPYYIDNKGYEIVEFGLGRVGKTTIPCYDRKNRRVIVISFTREMVIDWDGSRPIISYADMHKFNPVYPVAGGKLDHIAPVWAMPEGTEVLLLCETDRVIMFPSTTSMMFSIYYNDKDGQTWMSDFVVSPKTGACIEYGQTFVKPFPGGNLDKDAVILTSALSKANWVIYSKGEEVCCIDRSLNDEIIPLLKAPSKVTYMGYTTNNTATDEYKKLVIGCENGELLFYDIANIRAPKLINEYKLNGKVVTCKEIGIFYGMVDAY